LRAGLVSGAFDPGTVRPRRCFGAGLVRPVRTVAARDAGLLGPIGVALFTAGLTILGQGLERGGEGGGHGGDGGEGHQKAFHGLSCPARRFSAAWEKHCARSMNLG